MMTVQNTFLITVGVCSVNVSCELNIFRPRRFLT